MKLNHRNKEISVEEKVNAQDLLDFIGILKNPSDWKIVFEYGTEKVEPENVDSLDMGLVRSSKFQVFIHYYPSDAKKSYILNPHWSCN